MFKYLKSIQQYGDMAAFIFVDENETFEVSYTQYFSDVKKCAYKLEKVIRDIKGKHIALIGQNSYEYIVVMCALIYSRAVFIPLNFRESTDNLEFAIKHAEVEYLIAEASENYDNISGVKKITFKELLNGQDEKELFDFDDEEADRLLMIVYTSGTTSLSKGVSLSVSNLLKKEKKLFPEEYSRWIKAEPGYRVYTNFPFYHIGGILVWIAMSEYGCTLIQSKNPRNILVDLEYNRIDCAVVIPATVKLWLKAIKRGNVNRLGGAKIIITGGAPISVDDVKAIRDSGILFGQYYGMTETGGIVTFNFDMENHIASVGRCFDNAEITIVEGEICINHWGNMLGYYNNEEETKACQKDGIIYTGDLGYKDEDGYIYITGRKKNLIILSGGENVSPEEIEQLLYKNSKVKECKAFEKNDRIVVEIYCDEADQQVIREYIDELNTKVPIYKRVYDIVFQNKEFEKTISGKIKR